MSLSALKHSLPWPAKIALKIVLSRLPASTGFWRRMDLFRHGAMQSPDYAFSVVTQHVMQAGLTTLNGLTCLELGPGDSLFSALIAKSLGAERTYLIDAGSFADTDLAPYLNLAAFLAEKNLPVPPTNNLRNLNDLLRISRGIYGNKGLKSLQEIPDACVDIVWSQAVLEHIRHTEFPETMQQLRRIIKPGGICSHRIDLRDHLAGALNNLRFSEKVWESNFFASSGFYTNRIQYKDMVKLFKDAGFAVEIIAVDRWNQLPTPRKHMARPFRDLPEEELSIVGFDVLLRPAATS